MPKVNSKCGSSPFYLNFQSLEAWGDICHALPDLVPFVQFKKREKHPWGSVLHVFKIVQMVPNRAKHHIIAWLFFHVQVIPKVYPASWYQELGSQILMGLKIILSRLRSNGKNMKWKCCFKRSVYLFDMSFSVYYRAFTSITFDSFRSFA